MAQTIKINGVTYEAKQIDVPLASDTSKKVTFHDTSDATAKAASIKDGETAYIGGAKVEGTMPVNGAVSSNISTKDGTVTVPEGYTPGGTVGISSTEKEKLIAANIRKGVTVLGVTGSMSGLEETSDANATADDIKSGKTAYVNGKKVTGSHTDPAFSLANGVLTIV